jgi:ABC-type dipeptide/oligopeptide/nickel transport system ATPase component
MEPFKKLKKELHLSMLLITHDLGLVNFLADRAFVLHQGKIVESGPAQEIFSNPKHSFTKQLARTMNL